MNLEDQNELPHGLPVDELVLVSNYRRLDHDLKDDLRRFAQACLKQQRARTLPSNIVKFPRKY